LFGIFLTTTEATPGGVFSSLPFDCSEIRNPLSHGYNFLGNRDTGGCDGIVAITASGT